MNQIYYHVTEREDAETILQEGFQGGWGDVGFGVYFYGCLSSASAYADRGGWDNRLKDPVIIEVFDADIEQVLPHPSWNPDTYADMHWRELDEDDGEALWKPQSMRLLQAPDRPASPKATFPK